MSILMFAIISITLALLFYTIGVWSEHLKKQLTKTHVVLFIIGLIFDTAGTCLMSRIAGSGGGNNMLGVHGITGTIAIVLMLVHAVWAVLVLRKNDAAAKENFHKYSVAVWFIWLVPYIIGMVMGMR